MRTHDETAAEVLQDYARLAIDEYVRRAMGSVGYYGYYTTINELRVLVQQDADFPHVVADAEPGSQAARARQLAQSLLLVELDSAELQATREVEPAFNEYVVQRSQEMAQQPPPESGMVIDHAVIDGEQHTLVLSQLDDHNKVFGFEVDQIVLRKWLQRAFGDGPLLPESLADGAVGNDSVYLRHADADNALIFESGAMPSPYLAGSRDLGEEYGGIFLGHVVTAALDTTAADSLIIGGLPRSRLPVLFALMIVTVGLLIATIRQLRREYAVMMLRSNFVAEVSHELRTPLTQIRMFTETLLLDRMRTAEDRQRALQIIGREAQRLIHLVENVLRFSTNGRSTEDIDLVEQPLAPIVESIVDEFTPMAAAADMHIKFSADASPAVAVDPDALRQAVLNLLDNAVKYGPAGQEITLSIDTGDKTVRLCVADQGPGIPPGNREDIWSPYQRLSRERQSAIAGAGIGLAVVRDIAQRLGGRAYVQDTSDVGACFVLELPLATANGSAA
jgi:signal transduction histidine kinase